MSWLANLTKTYDDHIKLVGQFERKQNGREYALIPVSHTTQTAHVEVHLDEDGEFITAYVRDKVEGSTIIPCTEAAASRTSAPVPYPLFDKLLYVAGDYVQYCGEVKGTPYQDYLDQLKAWCDSPYSHPKVQIVYEYVSRGTLITDLIAHKVLHTDSNNKLLKKWEAPAGDNSGEKPKIFSVIAGEQSSAFIRFAVNIPGEDEYRLWRDSSVQQSFIRFQESSLSDMDICYVTGEILPIAEKHTSRIRHSGDKSKLISANDSAGFTYRGRFRTSREAAAVSYMASQKGHNALKWLIDRQGITVDGKVFLVWGSHNLDMPEPHQDSYDLQTDAGVNIVPEDYDPDDEIDIYTIESAAGIPSPVANRDTTSKAYARQIKKAVGGYRYDGKQYAHVTIMILDAATPGRMSITYYRDLNHEEYLNRLEVWHTSCYWQHRYRKNDSGEWQTFTGAPATRDIAFAAYGPRASDKVVKGLMERILPCIVETNRAIPKDIVRSAVQRASNPVGMEPWEWEKTLSITCALVKKLNEEAKFEVAVNTETTDRNYLFGRMLAIADVLERRALGREEKRATNAVRYMNAFAQHPQRTWTIIQSNLQPYQARMGTDANYYNALMDEVGSKFELEDFTDAPLTGLYLLGFYSQRNDLFTSKKTKEDQRGGEN
ncbi:type I-C CRISPR-associated protein Cas8c/Csd1 [Paenibacillus typhae]|uniref:type I-C CRISPR-associated protein Cas8c/Csd1 n=1 Tax=Paenibacillus typhae TaxID=1174501 RepID=UPI001C8DD48C|nr:type I-C CRISPR-associated protein Cas8c/Csd1 [Paenibacillus typhae]MBY0014417.1 type I-C CRISPR-associated protein Cas8c/Csd1 [Paenibacillus typhae]